MDARNIFIISLLTAATAACGHRDKAARDTNAAEAMPVQVSEVVTDSVTLYKDYPATFEADRTIDVLAQVNGTILTMNFNGGEFVRRGQVLFTIDPTTYANAVSEAEAALAEARSQNKFAEQHYNALLAASKSNAVSQMEVEQGLATRDQSRAAIRNAEAQLSTASKQLSYCTVTAPCDGHISINEKSRGAYVAGEGAPVKLATVYDDATLLANFSIEDASFQRSFLNENNRSMLDYTAIPLTFAEKLPHTYTGDLTYMAPNVDVSTGTMHLQAVVKNPYNELKSGMYLTVRLPYMVEPRACLVRDASIATDQLGKYVYLVNDSNKVVYTPVKVGDLVSDTMRVVTQGVRPGDRYVTAALLKVRDGMTVKPFTSK